MTPAPPAAQAHMLEFQQFNAAWDKKFEDYEAKAAELEERMQVPPAAPIAIAMRQPARLCVCSACWSGAARPRHLSGWRLTGRTQNTMNSRRVLPAPPRRHVVYLYTDNLQRHHRSHQRMRSAWHAKAELHHARL